MYSLRQRDQRQAPRGGSLDAALYRMPGKVRTGIAGRSSPVIRIEDAKPAPPTIGGVCVCNSRTEVRFATFAVFAVKGVLIVKSRFTPSIGTPTSAAAGPRPQRSHSPPRAQSAATPASPSLPDRRCSGSGTPQSAEPRSSAPDRTRQNCLFDGPILDRDFMVQRGAQPKK